MISTAVARPRTPTRSLGHERFRIAVDGDAGKEGNIQQQVNYDESNYGIHLDFSEAHQPGHFFARGADTSQNEQMSPPSLSMATGYGLSTSSGGETPSRGQPRTMYGTEIQANTRFGDFGRDQIASSSGINFWGF